MEVYILRGRLPNTQQAPDEPRSQETPAREELRPAADSSDTRLIKHKWEIVKGTTLTSRHIYECQRCGASFIDVKDSRGTLYMPEARAREAGISEDCDLTLVKNIQEG